MIELTDREKKLLEIIKILINVMTIWGIYEGKAAELRSWAYKSMGEAGLSMEWQDEILKMLESDFGVKYTKLNPETLEKQKEL